MFRARQSEKKAPDELLAEFRQQFPSIGLGGPIRLSPSYNNRGTHLWQVLKDQPGPAAVTKRKLTAQQLELDEPSKRPRTGAELEAPCLSPLIAKTTPQSQNTTPEDRDQLACPFPSSKASCATQHTYLTKLLQHLLRDHHFHAGPKGQRRKWLALYDVDAPDAASQPGPIFCLGCNRRINNLSSYRVHEKQCVRDKRTFTNNWRAIQEAFEQTAPSGAHTPPPSSPGTAKITPLPYSLEQRNKNGGREAGVQLPASNLGTFEAAGAEAKAKVYQEILFNAVDLLIETEQRLRGRDFSPFRYSVMISRFRKSAKNLLEQAEISGVDTSAIGYKLEDMMSSIAPEFLHSVTYG